MTPGLLRPARQGGQCDDSG